MDTGDEKSVGPETPPPREIHSQKRGSTPTPLFNPLKRENEKRKEIYEVGKSGESSIFGLVEIGFSKFIYVRKGPS